MGIVSFGKFSELLPQDMPARKGKCVVEVSYYDANLCHNVVTGRSVAGVLQFLNKNTVDWYSNKQATVETACGSECSSALTFVENM